MNNIIKKITFLENTPIKKILDSFGKNQHLTSGRGFGLILNKKKQCQGTLTDGDVRRYLLRGGSIKDMAKLAMKKSFKYINSFDSRNIILRKFEALLKEQKGVYVLPVLKENNKIVSIINYSELKNFRNYKKTIYTQIPCRVSFSGGGLDFTDNINVNINYILCSTINKYIKVICRTREDEQIKIFNYAQNQTNIFKNLNELGKKNDFISKIINFAQPTTGFEIEIYSDVNFGTGLGSSSATVTAILSTINKLNNYKRELYSLVEDAYQVERIELNNSGGWQDYYSTAFGGINWIEMNSRDILVNPLKISDHILAELQNNLILIKLGTRKLNLKKKKKKKSIYMKINTSLMKKISLEMKESLLKGKLDNFALLMDKAWSLKKKINKNSDILKINNLYKNLKKAGAIGGKLLGAGGSGYMLIYTPLQKRRNLETLLKKKKIQYENLFFSNNGIETWETNQI
jgi:D-glycero-alpha-D-manno-heptose-7-phosphate kinase